LEESGWFRQGIEFRQATDRNKIFENIQSPPAAGFRFEYFLLSLLEAGLQKIIVVDDRIAKESVNIRGENNGFAPSLLRLNAIRCYPVYSIGTVSTREFIAEVLRPIEEFLPSEEKLCLTDPSQSCLVEFVQKQSRLESRSEVNLRSTGELQADFIVLHQGIIDAVIAPQVKDQSWFQNLYQIAPMIVITSGRGNRLDHVPDDTPFLEFAVVQDALSSEPSKYHLSRALGSIKGTVGNVKGSVAANHQE
jgi:hypothetical protein